MNPYETDKLLGEYLLFHYGSAQETAPPMPGLEAALDYPVRCVTECFDLDRLPGTARALDLGCAVGRSTFELGRHCPEVVGIDFSKRFIDAAETIRRDGELSYGRTDEGLLSTALVARAPREVDRRRVRFETGDAMDLRADLGSFDAVLMANLIDRLADPQRCLAQLGSLLNSGGQLVITSPYTWLEEFTPGAHWVGGFRRGDEFVRSLDGLHAALDGDFELSDTRDLPFLIREHARKFQLSLAEASIWWRRQ
ncbi:MAG: putative 4-mercaptohistidine N1-methyltransferase [Chthoniobacteraceae bacterium]